MAADLTSAMRPGMIVLADRNYGYASTITTNPKPSKDFHPES